MIEDIVWDGRKISKPGKYSNVPISAYHSADICDGPSISSSGLRKIFSESPAHFYADWVGNQEHKEEKDKAHFILGRAVHMLSLGEPYFAKLFCEQPATYRGRNKAGELELKPWTYAAEECKKWRTAREGEGRAILTPTDVENIKGMARALGHHPLIRAGVLNGQIERSIFWKDDETGVWLKSRPDAIPNDSGDMVDLKTCQSVHWNDLVRSIGDFGYHAQGALIRQATRDILRMENPTFSLVFVEKKIPWCVRIVTLKHSDLDRGEQQNRMALDTFAKCLKDNHWPGPGGDREDAENIELSEFMQKHIDDKLKFGLAT